MTFRYSRRDLFLFDNCAPDAGQMRRRYFKYTDDARDISLAASTPFRARASVISRVNFYAYAMLRRQKPPRAADSLTSLSLDDDTHYYNAAG